MINDPRYFVTPNDADAVGRDDAESIQNAVNIASETGLNRVVVPRLNARTGGFVWDIARTVLLPSGMNLLLEGAFLRLADGAACNMFSNSNIYTEAGRTLAGEQTDITIRGSDGATLDGGVYNGLSERNSLKDGNPHISRNTTILFSNVNRFRVENLRVTNQRWWGMTFVFCRNGKIADIDFKADYSWVDADGVRHTDSDAPDYGSIYVKNADGVDLRTGCNNITIENITGFTEDDTVALTALTGPNFEGKLLVEGKDTDIHDVIIKNIRSDCYFCATVRLLNADGNRLYNVLIDGVLDESDHTFGRERSSHSTIRLNDNVYGRTPVKHGEMSDIIVTNIVSRARYAVSLSATVKNLHVSNVAMRGASRYALGNTAPGTYENISLSGVSHSNPTPDCKALRLENCTAINVKVTNILTPELEGGGNGDTRLS